METIIKNYNSKLLDEYLNGKSVITCGFAIFDPHSVAHVGEKHRHDYDEIFLVISGEMKVLSNNILSQGDFVVIPANTEHHVTNISDVVCSVMYIVYKEVETNV